LGEGGVARLRPAGALVTSARSEQQAKRLRVAPTFTERLFWKGLRTLKMPGAHFRRQAPIGPYVTDFACLGARLVIELDGGVHGLPEVADRDAARQAWLEDQGFLVLRFSDKQVIDNLDAVLAPIETSVRSRASPPPPAPSPQGGGG
jgi:very-short-patch-repair endonuclease